jgi:hypothetical protein
MTISLHDATVATFLQHLRALDGIVAKAEAFCAAGSANEADLLDARIAPDMAPLTTQLKWARSHSLGAVEGLKAGKFAPDMSDAPATLAAHRANLAATIAGLEAVSAAELDALSGGDVLFTIPQMNLSMPFTAPNFMFSFALPNFFFHVTTAYDLLRAAGLEIGKRDFLGAMRLKG